MTSIRFFVLSFLLCVSTIVFAQKVPMKFGKVGQEEVQMQVYEKDSSASAVVLCDFGTSYIDYGNDGFQLIFERQIRIKIFNKDGYDWGDVTIPIYQDGGDKEKVTSLKGFTYNLENGKVVRDKLNNKAIFEEEESKHWSRIKFSLPNVKEGAVIEYSYRIVSDFIFNYQSWYFQHSIPVVWSEYRARFIEYYNYQKLMQGFVPLHINETQTGRQQFSIKTDSELVGGASGRRTAASVDSYEASATNHRWVAKDVPAFKKEPYMTTANNYISKIQFELQSTNFPQEPIKPIMGTWQSLNKSFLESQYFGLNLNKSAYFSKEMELLDLENASSKEKVAKVYSFVKDRMKWNGFTSKYMEGTLRQAYNKKEGNSSDINLILVSMLRKAGFKADPVLISTRNHGLVREEYALSKQFNYVIAIVELEGELLLMDATDKYMPLGVLPKRCINGRGWRVSATSPGWISLEGNVKDSQAISASLALSDEGDFSGNLAYVNKGYSGIGARKSYSNKGDEEYIKQFKESKDWEIESFEVDLKDQPASAFKQNCEVIIDGAAEALGDMIYFNPFVDGKTEENPFKLGKRDFPVDFVTPFKELYMVKITIPEGYVVDEVPENKIMALPNQAGKYLYNITKMGDTINLTSSLVINKGVFFTNEYPYLKEFFSQLVAKQAEQIVLKKVK